MRRGRTGENAGVAGTSLSPQISAREFVARALEAFRSWPEDLLVLPLDHAKLAEPVRE
jgi:hypothetical protein